MDVSEGVVVEEKCGLDVASNLDLLRVNSLNCEDCVAGKGVDGSEFEADAAGSHKYGLVLNRENGETTVVSDDALNEEEFGNASVVSTRPLHHETFFDHEDSGNPLFHGSIREDDAGAGESTANEFCAASARCVGVAEAVEDKVLVLNAIGDIDIVVKGEHYPSEDLEISEIPFSSPQNPGLRVDALVPVVESDENSKSSSGVNGLKRTSIVCQGPKKEIADLVSEANHLGENFTHNISSIVDFSGGALEKVAEDENVRCPRESEDSHNSTGNGEFHAYSSAVAAGSRNFVESCTISSHENCCPTNGNHKWEECVEPSATGAPVGCRRCPEVDGIVQGGSGDVAKDAPKSVGIAELEVPEPTPIDVGSNCCSNKKATRSPAKSTLCDMKFVNVKEQEEGSLANQVNGDAERYDEHATLLKGGEIAFGTMNSIIRITSPAESPKTPVSNGHVTETEVEICHVKVVSRDSKPGSCEMGLFGVNGSENEESTEPEPIHNGHTHPSEYIPLSSEKLMEVVPCGNGELKLPEAETNGDQVEASTRSSDSKTLSQVNQKSQNFHADHVTDAAPEENGSSLIEREARTDTQTKPFNFLVRIPRSDDSTIREHIRLAKMHVDEKTKLRDAIQDHIQRRRASSQAYATDYEHAAVEARNAGKLVRLKRLEIDSLHSVINKAKNAMSIRDIDIQIRKVENMIQHETLPLKEEKLLIREIKQLKQLREQLSSSLGSQDDINQALEQRGEVEERLKALRKELDVLKDGVLRAEEAAIEAGRKYESENAAIKELRSRFRDADDVRQAAFAHLQDLRKDLWTKNKLFFKYKDDATVASNYAFAGNNEALYQLCLGQVENFMNMWNTSESFRSEYVQCSVKSTLRRFGTLGGRTLCTDEKPARLPSYADGVDRIIWKPIDSDQRSANSFLDSNEEIPFITIAPYRGSTSEVPEVKYREVDGPLREDQHNEEPEITISMKEVESLQDEEQRMHEAEEELKEQRRLEELAKANEARERKKRQLEKLQQRAEMKTLKEAQEKEKKREKRLRKMERKKASVSDNSDISNNCETSPSSDKAAMELTKEIDVIPRKPQNRWLFSKHPKTKSVPPHLRNRNKKKWQQWMLVGATSLFILVLFWLGNVGKLSSVNLRRRSHTY